MSTPSNTWNRLNLRLARTPAGAWVYARVLHHLDGAMLALTGGRTTATALFSGFDPVWLTTTGARTGRPRTLPLVATPDGENLILIASNWGQDHLPAWYRNLTAHPEASVRVRGLERRYSARDLQGAEKEAAWAKAVANYAGYADYRRRTTRDIPVILLSPL